MAPLADVPPMPPIPEDELHPQSLPKPGGAPAVDTEAAKRSVITVRYNRRLGWWLTLTGWPLLVLTSALLVRFFAYRDLVMLPWMSALGAVILGTVLLARRVRLTYNPTTGAVGAKSADAVAGLNGWREGDRIEYWIPFAELRIVHPDGRHRQLVKSSFMLDRESWNQFVDVFLAQQQRRAARDTGLQDRVPAASAVGADPEIRVGVRRRGFVVALLIGLALTAIAAESLVNTDGPLGLLGIATAGYLLVGAPPLLVNPVLVYESGADRLTVKTRGRPAREIPRQGYERLEYSVYTAVLYEVRANGRRRRIATGWLRDQVAWKIFVDRFREDHPTGRHHSVGGEKR